MSIRFSILVLWCLFGSACANANRESDIVGTYRSDEGAVLNIRISSKDQELLLGLGHQSQAANTDPSAEGICYMFSNFDLILPTKFTSNASTSCLGGSARVVSVNELFALSPDLIILATLIEVTRKREIKVGNKTYQRPSGPNHYYLYWSEEKGLIGINLSNDKNDKTNLYRKLTD